jgi:hypothetical protein
MTTTVTPQPPAGSDGVQPIYEPNRRWTQWNMAELYMGPTTPGSQHFVPNVNDMAVDLTTFQWYLIIAVDPTSFIPSFTEIVEAVPDDQFSDIDRLLSPGPGPRPSTYILYINQSVKPFSAAIDARLYVMGTAVASCQVVTGSALEGNQQIISAVYDQTGDLVGQSIPLETVDAVGAIKVVPPFSTTTALANGEVVTAIFFSATGDVVSMSQLVVENTAFIRGPDQGVKYVTGISIKSPFISQSDPTQIIYPLNLPLTSLNMMGVVNYSDGSSITLPVDGTKFTMFGLNNGFVATVIGQKVPLILKYNLSADEVAYGVSANSQYFITQEFTAITKQTEGQYTVKLFGYPVWVDAITGYTIQWYLFNLDRTTYYNVTPYVTYQNALNPTGYGIQQNLQVQLNLQSVNGSFGNYIFTQTIGVSLLSQGTETDTNWEVTFSPGQSPVYGADNSASVTMISENLWLVDLSLGEDDVNDWLDRIYWTTEPLYNPSLEVAAPTPNMFSVIVNGVETVFPISQWNQTLTINQSITPYSTLFVRFFRRTSNNDLQLAMAGVPAYPTSNVTPVTTPVPSGTPAPTVAPTGMQISIRAGWFNELGGAQSLYYPVTIGSTVISSPPTGPNAASTWSPVTAGVTVGATDALLNLALIDLSTGLPATVQPVSWGVSLPGNATLFSAGSLPYTSVYSDAEETMVLVPNLTGATLMMNVVGTFADLSTVIQQMPVYATPVGTPVPTPTPAPSGSWPCYTYQFVNSGLPVIESYPLDQTGAITQPRWSLQNQGLQADFGYPGGVANLNYSPAYTIAGTAITIPTGTATDLDALWNSLQNPYSAQSQAFTNFITMTRGTAGAITANGLVVSVFENVSAFIEYLVELNAFGNTSDQVWAGMTTQLQAAGLYTGSNQAIIMPLWEEMAVTYSNSTLSPPVTNSTETVYVFTDSAEITDTIGSINYLVSISAPTVMIERIVTTTPSPTPTPLPSITMTPTPTASATPAPTVTPTPTTSATPTPTPTATPTPSPSATPTPTPSASPTPTPSPSATASPTPSPSATPTPSPSATPTPSPSATATPTPSPSPTASATPAPSATPTPSPTATPTPTPSGT